MPLDEPSQRFVTALETLYNDAHNLAWPELRKLIDGEYDFMAPPEPVSLVSGHLIPADHGTIEARLYKAQADARLPVLLFLHGGGWAVGSLDHSDRFCRAVANLSDCAILSLNYRLAPEAPYPAALEDCVTALAWLHAEEDALGVDASRIGVGGESAGGNLAAALCRLISRRGGPPISYQCLLCPPLDASMGSASHREFGQGYGLANDWLRHAWSTYSGVAPGDDPYVSPLLDVGDVAMPRTFIVIAECDPLRDEGLQYAQRLIHAGTDVGLRCYAGQPHCFFLFDRVLPRARAAVVDIARDVRAALGSRSD